jgi:hypothetical protein
MIQFSLANQGPTLPFTFEGIGGGGKSGSTPQRQPQHHRRRWRVHGNNVVRFDGDVDNGDAGGGQQPHDLIVTYYVVGNLLLELSDEERRDVLYSPGEIHQFRAVADREQARWRGGKWEEEGEDKVEQEGQEERLVRQFRESTTTDLNILTIHRPSTTSSTFPPKAKTMHPPSKDWISRASARVGSDVLPPALSPPGLSQPPANDHSPTSVFISEVLLGLSPFAFAAGRSHLKEGRRGLPPWKKKKTNPSLSSRGRGKGSDGRRRRTMRPAPIAPYDVKKSSS